jgi:tetratricopeptide (TPR) repeat protein
MRGAILGAWVIAAVWPIEGQAQSYRQLSQWCYGQSSDTETVVGCDAVIRWSRESPRDTGTAFYNRGIAYRNQGRLDRAIEDYDLALRLRPDFADAWNERGVAYRQKGDMPRALEDFNEAIRLKPDHAVAFFNRGAVWADLGQFDRAIADFDRTLDLQPGDPDSLFGRGMARRGKGDTAGGDADIAAARARRPALSDVVARSGVN